MAVGDGWDWELTHDTTVEYRRNIDSDARIVLENIQVTDIGAFEWGPPVVVSEDVKERRLVPIRLHTGSSYVVKTSEAFTRTTTLEEAAKVGLELAMETHFGYKASTTTGGLEGGGSISAKATAEYSRKWGSSTSTTESADRALTINGPFVGQAEMVRSISKISRTITTPPTLEHQIIVYDGDTELYRWNTFAELILVLQGAAPTDRALSKKFYKAPLSQTELHAIFAHQSIAPVDVDGALRQRRHGADPRSHGRGPDAGTNPAGSGTPPGNGADHRGNAGSHPAGDLAARRRTSRAQAGEARPQARQPHRHGASAAARMM